MTDALQNHLNKIYPVSRETIDRLERYFELLKQWQSKTNLVAPSTLDQFWSRHVADSLQLLTIAPKGRHWTDIGSGGGFPGLVLAIVMAQVAKETDEPTSVRLVESIQKKCAFLRRVGVETGIPVEVQAQRIESATKQIEAGEIITARALASLPKLLDLTGMYLTGSRRALFHKGREYLSELEDSRGMWKFDLLVHESKIVSDSVVLEISNVERRLD
ncbi:MAG: 16S rRNA (guanine(527)-N(7))-methyltransferase RsmG [Salaquimonas sp.]